VIPEDFSKAFEWGLKAAMQGLAASQYLIGLGYKNGEGAPKDHQEAARWLCMAAEKDYAGAQYELGICYLNGEGVPKDMLLAYKWINLAAGHGDEDSAALREDIEGELTKEQLVEAQRLSREFHLAAKH
jgi:TPR repeat protein